MVLVLLFGCSSSNVIDPLSPASFIKETNSSENHLLWGIYQFICNPDAQTIEVTPLRGLDMHLNALIFLEPPPMVNLTLESLEFNGNIIEADIGLRHPFLGLDEFTGFDVSEDPPRTTVMRA